MDKKGQSTVIFIILIPVFLVLTAIIVDYGINSYNEKKLKNVTEDVMEVLLDEDLSDIEYDEREEVAENLKKTAKRIYENNKVDTEFLYIEISYNNQITMSNIHGHYSFMNSLLGKGNGNRQSTIEVRGYLDDSGEKIIEIEGEDYENK